MLLLAAGKKRFWLRLSALPVVAVLGLIAMAHAQHSSISVVDSSAPNSASDSNPQIDPFGGPRAPAGGDSTVRIVSVDDQHSGSTPSQSSPFVQPPRLLSAPQQAARAVPPASSGSPYQQPESAATNPGDSSSEIRLIAGPTPTLVTPTSDPSQPAAKAPSRAPAVIAADDSGPRPLNLASTTPTPIAAPLPIPPADEPRAAPPSAPRLIAPQADSAALAPVDNSAPQNPSPSAVAGTGRPGPRQLEGMQTPQLAIEKRGPAEIQVGKPAKFEIHVHNTGIVPAIGVEVHDEVPQGAAFISSTPAASPDAEGHLSWSLGTLRPGEQATIVLQLAAQTEGEIGSVASVSFRAEASARTLATKPQLALEVAAPKQAMIGSDVTLSVRVSNTGTGAATGVVLLEHVPDGMRHVAGPNLEYEVGTLKPGASRQIELAINAARAGHVVNLLKARGEGSVLAEAHAEWDIVAPALAVAMTGPTRRFLERQATYTVSVSNPGTAPAKDVELVTQLPRGMKFVRANNAGQYDPQTHTVTWSLEELPPSETGNVTLVAMPVEPGEQTVKISGKAQQGLADQRQQTIVVEGLAAVEFDVHGADEAIEVGGDTTYQIHVVNHGSAAATNLRLTALLPPELKVTHVDGPGHPAFDEHRVELEPLAQLAPKAEVTFRIRAQALAAGDLRVKVQLQTDDMRQPVNKEESTRVYVDR